MKLRPWIERAIVYTGLVIGLNYFGLPLCYNVSINFLKRNVEDKRIQEVCHVDSHLETIAKNIDTENADAVPFVRAAHAFTSKLLEYKLTSFDEFDKALSGRGDCSYFSNFTYSNFLYLVEKFNRDDLKDKVRLAAGHIIDDKGKLEGVHAWLQVLHNGKWVNYETTIDNLRDDDELDFNHLDIMVWPFALSSSTDGTYHFSYVKHEKGKLQTYTNISASLDSDVTFWDWIKLHAKLAMEKDD